MQLTVDASFALVVLVGTIVCLAILRDHKARLSARHGKSQIDLKTTPQGKKGKK